MGDCLDGAGIWGDGDLLKLVLVVLEVFRWVPLIAMGRVYFHQVDGGYKHWVTLIRTRCRQEAKRKSWVHVLYSSLVASSLLCSFGSFCKEPNWFAVQAPTGSQRLYLELGQQLHDCTGYQLWLLHPHPSPHIWTFLKQQSICSHLIGCSCLSYSQSFMPSP